MNTLENMMQKVEIEDDNKAICDRAIDSDNLDLMYRVAEDIHENYCLVASIYPPFCETRIRMISVLVHLILQRSNVRSNFILMCDLIRELTDLLSEVKI
jgi:hypothetical protein